MKARARETRIRWDLPSAQVHNHIRGLSPFPGAWFELNTKGKVERVKVLRSTMSTGEGEPGEALDDHLTIACGSGAVRLTHLQRAGKKPMTGNEYLRGQTIAAGTHLA